MSTNTIPENVHLPRKPEPPKFLFNGYVQAPVSVEGKFLYNTAIFGSFGALVGLSKFYYTPHRTLQYHESATAMNMLKKYYSFMKGPAMKGAIIGTFYNGAYFGLKEYVNNGEDLSARQQFVTGLSTGVGIGLIRQSISSGITSGIFIGSILGLATLFKYSQDVKVGRVNRDYVYNQTETAMYKNLEPMPLEKVFEPNSARETTKITIIQE